MIKKIKELRVTIDGLAQLTKNLMPTGYIFDRAILPPNKTFSQLLEELKKEPATIVNSADKPYVQTLKSPEIENAHTSLLLAKAWLGNLLGLIGEQTPYANDGKRSDVNDIEQVADTKKNLTINKDGGFEEMNHIEKVDYLREQIKLVIHEVMQIVPIAAHQPHLREAAIARTNAYNHLCEAGFHLGFELQRIKEAKA